MSVIGPRPQLVRDMVFMTDEQRMRHTAKPGLSGLAQVNGRNTISWEDKLEWDLKYIKNISLAEDIKIILSTVKKAFIKQEGITQDDMATAEDLGDYLLRTGKVVQNDYEQKQQIAKNILNGDDGIEREKGLWFSMACRYGRTICPGGYGEDSGKSGTGVGIPLQTDGIESECACYCDQPVRRDSRYAGGASSCKGKGNDNPGNRECGRKQYCT